jgi:prepilin-type N-terminal cleavage/methylation domain-containing protein
MRRGTAGFTLLEIMVAVAILSATLVVLLQIVTNNIRATNHAKLTTAATFLARNKMSDIEDTILYNGFTSETETAKGTFKEDGYPQYRWESLIERIELPTDMTQKSQEQATKSSLDSKDPMKMMTGFLGGMMSTFIEPIRIGLQESVRKVTVRVFWDETGRRNQTIEVVQYLTDPSQIEKSMAGSIAGAAGGAGAPGTQTPGTAPNPNQNPNIPRGPVIGSPLGGNPSGSR